MRQPSLTEFKRWAKDHYRLAHTVCMAQAYAQLKREQVDAYIKPLFAMFEFYPADEWVKRGMKRERITDIKDLYLTDLESAEYKEFMEECDIEHRKHGFDGEPGYCPALVAENLQIEAENALIEEGKRFLGIEDIGGPYMENRKKLLDLLLGACLNSQKAA